MPERITASLTALGIAIAPALLKFAEVGDDSTVEVDEEAEVQCVRDGEAPVHRRFKGTGDIEARLSEGSVVQVVSKRKNWRHIAYVLDGSAELGWITTARLDTCDEPTASRDDDTAATPPRSSAAIDLSALDSSPHVMLGVPTDEDPSDDFLIDHGVYVLSYNRKINLPNWVAWRLKSSDLGDEDRQNDFRADDALPGDFLHVDDDDFAGTGFDRGHLCPSAHRTGTEESNSLTFLMTNMQPQVHALNAGPWKSLETFERNLADRDGKELYIVAGGLFSKNPKTLGPGIAVPTRNYRIGIVLDAGQGIADVTAQTPIHAVEMPNDVSVRGHKWTEFAVTIDKVEDDSGYDFLSTLGDPVENRLEASQPLSQ